jgi:FtsP/CotA-like multicopper oxidase with cupredoxin domain/fibronectin type 3 domain-containing protein
VNGGVNWPSYFPTMAGDDRMGGVPDPALAGPSMIEIANEAGLLPQPWISTNIPIGYAYNRRTVVVLNVQEHALLLGPAERADVLVDFAPYAGQTLILYNDSPAPIPGFDPRNDTYTGDSDQSDAGGPGATLPGMGPNSRTIMQVRVRGTAVGTASTTNMVPGTLPLNWVNPARYANLVTNLPAAFKATQQVPIVPEPWFDPVGYTYNGTNGAPAPLTITHIQDNSITYIPYGSTNPVTAPYIYKAIHELFDDTGRMNAVLGTELPFTSAYIQTTLPLAYVDPATEVVAPGETQFWWIAHNGVDTHSIHFHLVDVQIINRVGWDGAIYQDMIDPNEYGFKDSVRMNPLENILVAVRAKTPQLPFGIPDAIRPLDATSAIGSTNHFSGIDPYTGNAVTVTNQLVNNKWEYMWHCHLLGHEENDMMRPISYTFQAVPPTAPGNLSGAPSGANINVTWTDATPRSDTNTWGNPANEIGFQLFRAPITRNGNTLVNGAFAKIATVPANRTNYLDTTASAGGSYAYQIAAFNAAGTNSSAIAQIVPGVPSTPTNLTLAYAAGPGVSLAWTDTSTNAASFLIERALNSGFTTGLTTVATVTVPTTNYTDLTVALGNQYYYRVSAQNGSGKSAPSLTATIGVYLPAAPTTFAGLLTPATLTVGPSVALSWANTATNATSVFVLKANNAAFTGATTITLAASATSYTDGTPVPGATNYYKVQTANVLGASTAVNVVSFAVGAVPSTPATLAVSQSGAVSALLSWTQAGVTPSGYLVQRAADAGFTTSVTSFIVNSGTAGYTDSTVVAGSTYYYQVYARTTGGYSPVSATVSLTILGAPSNLAVVGSVGATTNAALSWTAAVGTPSGYTVQRGNNAAFTGTVTSIVAGNVTSYNDGTITPGTTYYYRVQATGTTGSSAYSAVVSLLAPVLTVPTTPTALAVTPAGGASTDTNTLTWVNGSVYQTSVSIVRSINAAFNAAGQLVTNVVAGTATTYVDSTAANNTTYWYRVYASNAAGNSAVSAAVTLTTPAAAPTAFAATPARISAAANSLDKVTLAWTRGTPGTNPANGYTIQRATNSTFSGTVTSFTAAAAATSFVDGTATGTTALPRATTYWYRIQALGTGGNSPWVTLPAPGSVVTP